jgi:hypothetical protein
MLKMFLDWPALTILYAFGIVLALIYIMCHLPDKWTNEKIFMGPFIFLCFSIMVVGVVSPILIYFSVKQPISNKAWKQVYTNNENASVEISFEDGYQGKYSIKAGENSSDNIQKLYNKLNCKSVVYDVKITVSQGKNKLTKVVAITKDNFVRNKVDLNNSQVTKVEYRPIEGFARKMFGEAGTPEESDETGEIKITLGSSENKNLKKIFED